MFYLRSLLLILCFGGYIADSHAQWSQAHHNTNGGVLHKITFSDSLNVLAVGDSATVLLSHDSGISWSKHTIDPGPYYDAEAIGNGNFILVKGTLIESILYKYNIFSGELDTLFISELYDQAWDLEMTGDSSCIIARYDGILSFDFTNNNAIMVWDFDDYFQGWINNICRVNDSIIYASGSISVPYEIYGILLKSINNGQDWEVVYDGYEHDGKVHAFSENILILYDSFIRRSTSGGNNWTMQTCYPDLGGHIRDLTSVNISDAFAAGGVWSGITNDYDAFIYKSTDGGIHWYRQYFSSTGQLRSLDFHDDSLGLACGDKETIVRTTNGGGIGVKVRENPDHPISITLFPNPATEHLNIILPWQESGYSFSVSNLLGKMIGQVQAAGKEQVQLDISDYSPGIYFIVVMNESGIVATQKFVKQ